MKMRWYWGIWKRVVVQVLRALEGILMDVLGKMTSVDDKVSLVSAQIKDVEGELGKQMYRIEDTFDKGYGTMHLDIMLLSNRMGNLEAALTTLLKRDEEKVADLKMAEVFDFSDEGRLRAERKAKLVKAGYDEKEAEDYLGIEELGL